MSWPLWLLIVWLFVIGLLVALTWTISQFVRMHNCETVRSIWCSDAWTCKVNIPSPGPGNGQPDCWDPVENKKHGWGISKCIYDHLTNDTYSKSCRTAKPGDTGTTCNCYTSDPANPEFGQTNQNCMSTCALNLGQAPSVCCTDDNPEC